MIITEGVEVPQDDLMDVVARMEVGGTACFDFEGEDHSELVAARQRIFRYRKATGKVIKTKREIHKLYARRLL